MAQPWDAKLGLLPAVEAMQVAGGWVLAVSGQLAGEVKVPSCTGVLSAVTDRLWPILVQAAWSAIRVKGRLQARYNRLARRFGGGKNPGAQKKAILAVAHTLLKIACQVLKTGTPYHRHHQPAGSRIASGA